MTAQTLLGGSSNGGVATLQTLPEEVSKDTLADWNDSAAEYVRSGLFEKKQFVDDEELVMGGIIQQLVCTHIHISGVGRARMYWDENGGKETVRNTFRRKRQTAQNAMKLAFRGKWIYNEVCIDGFCSRHLLLNQSTYLLCQQNGLQQPPQLCIAIHQHQQKLRPA